MEDRWGAVVPVPAPVGKEGSVECGAEHDQSLGVVLCEREDARKQAGVRLGESYPAPVIEHRTARARALAALKAMRGELDTAPSQA